MNRRAHHLRMLSGLLGALWLAVLSFPSQVLADDPCAEAVREALPASGCNRAMSLHVLDAGYQDTLGGDPAPPGRRWLVLEVRFDNWMPMDLVYGMGYQEALLVASLPRQLYLLVDDRLVVRARVPAGSGLDDEFVLPRAGARREGRVAFPVPEAGGESLSLRYYHDQYAPIRVSWRGEHASPGERRAAALDAEGHDLLSLGVQEFALHEQWQGEPAPEGMQWLVAEVHGQGEWRTPADARALDAGAPQDEEVPLRRVMEYVEAPWLLQAVVDERHGYVRDAALSTLEDDPALLPDAWAGGEAVFAVPEGAERIELVAYMPEFRGTDISGEIRPSLRFPLVTGDVAPTGEVLLEVEDGPIRLRLHELERVNAFAGHRAGAGESLVRIEASMTNVSDVGGMMAVSHRLRPQASGGELLGAYQAGPLAQVEPFWLPANDEPRHFTLVYRYADEAETLEFEYVGVAVNESLAVPIPR